MCGSNNSLLIYTSQTRPTYLHHPRLQQRQTQEPAARGQQPGEKEGAGVDFLGCGVVCVLGGWMGVLRGWVGGLLIEGGYMSYRGVGPQGDGDGRKRGEGLFWRLVNGWMLCEIRPTPPSIPPSTRHRRHTQQASTHPHNAPSPRSARAWPTPTYPPAPAPWRRWRPPCPHRPGGAGVVGGRGIGRALVCMYGDLGGVG